MAEFPRGWTLNSIQNASGVVASITAPATPGVVHVLDSIWAKMANYSSASSATPLVTVTVAAGVVLQSLLIIPAATFQVDTFSLSGLDIASAVGGTIVVAFNNPPAAGQWQEITIQGHDI